MKKTFGIAAAVMSCFCGAFAIEGIPIPAIVEEQLQGAPRLGKERIAEIRKNYNEGCYDPFLKEMDTSYEEMVEGEKIVEFGKLRGHPSSSEVLEKIQKIRQEKSAKLMQAVADKDSFLSKKVSSAALSPLSKGVEEILFHIHQMAPKEGSNGDENSWIELDVEYDYKVTHLNLLAEETDADLLREHYCALKMEQMNRLALLSQSFEDEDLKAAALELKENFDAQLSHDWDLSDLHTFLREKTSSSDPLEEKVLSILQDYRDQFVEIASKE